MATVWRCPCRSSSSPFAPSPPGAQTGLRSPLDGSAADTQGGAVSARPEASGKSQMAEPGPLPRARRLRSQAGAGIAARGSRHAPPWPRDQRQQPGEMDRITGRGDGGWQEGGARPVGSGAGRVPGVSTMSHCGALRAAGPASVRWDRGRTDRGPPRAVPGFWATGRQGLSASPHCLAQ